LFQVRSWTCLSKDGEIPLRRVLSPSCNSNQSIESNIALLRWDGESKWRTRRSKSSPWSPNWLRLTLLFAQVLEKRLDIAKAFKVYERALRLAPDNHVVQFKWIRGLVSLGRHTVSEDSHVPAIRVLNIRWDPQEALPALEDLAVRASQESNVVYLLGKLYRMTGQIEKSTIAFAHARDLNPKLSASIKAFIEGHDNADAETMAEADGGDAGVTIED